MANSYFQFKQFTIHQKNCAMKVSTDSCLFGAWSAQCIQDGENALDIGAGTGLLSLMICQKHQLKMDAVEIEQTCFGQLQENIQISNWNDRIKQFHNNILEFKGSVSYDIIISNPPFYEKQLQSDSHSINLARHQAGLTLDALFKKVDELLKSDGSFYLLLPAYRKQECIDTASLHGFYPSKITDVKQSVMHQPFRAMFCFRKEQCSPDTETITIMDKDNKYTTRFTEILKDYYLYL